MKKFFYLFLAFSLFALSCNEEQGIMESPGVTTYTEDVFISLPGARGTEILEGTISVPLHDETLELMGNVIPSQNLLDAANLSVSEFNQLLLEYALETKSGARVLDEDKGSTSDLPPSNHAGCIEWCNQNKEKKKGRGKCKSNCWTQSGLEVLKAAVKIF